MMNVQNIRDELKRLYANKEFVVDKSGSQMIEIINANFKADEDIIFGEPNLDYVERELQWYNSQSLKVADIPGGTPAIWKQVAGKTTGEINSNYGWAILSPVNFNQYESAKIELIKNRDSRRSIMIYTRPSMQIDYNRDGMSDFMCLRGDVIVQSPEGNLPIKEIVQKIKSLGRYPVFSVNFKSGEREIKWAVRGENTGRKKLVRVHLDDGSHIDCSEDHKFFIKYKTSEGPWVYGDEIKASHLRAGMSLIDLMIYKNGNGLCYKKTLSGEFTFQKRKLIHRDYYQFITGEDIEGYDIHHIDENPYNNSFANLGKLSRSEHRSHHLSKDNPVFKINDRTEQLRKMVLTLKESCKDRDLSWYENRNGVTFEESLSMAKEYFAQNKFSMRKFSLFCKENNLQKHNTVLSHACRLSDVSLKKLVYENTKVLYVEDLSIDDDVYDIEVEDNHNFFIGNGILVHNCTNSVQYFIRNNKLRCIVSMRSNDSVYGFKNDYHWQRYVQLKLLNELQPYYPNLEADVIDWSAGSLHVYPRHFKHLEA
jgi:hypothetical protein